MNAASVTNTPRFFLAGEDTATSLGAPLTLADEGSFHLNGAHLSSALPGATPPGRITSNQMYVHYRIPAEVKALPVIMVHGSNHTGVTYETTPDGREGWATYFVRRGHPVFVVDHAGRGRSGFNPTVINQLRDGGGNPAALPNLFLGTHERA